MLFSILCMTMIMVILFTMNGQQLSRWKLPIQPSSCVAVFSTIAKSALLYPIAECLGQLKWNYLETKRKLHDIQIFDEASRGPWGGFRFFWHITIRRRRKSWIDRPILASMAAILTVLLLSFEPFTQQVIQFSKKQVALEEKTGVVFMAPTFYEEEESYRGVTDSSPSENLRKSNSDLGPTCKISGE